MYRNKNARNIQVLNYPHMGFGGKMGHLLCTLDRVLHRKKAHGTAGRGRQWLSICGVGLHKLHSRSPSHDRTLKIWLGNGLTQLGRLWDASLGENRKGWAEHRCARPHTGSEHKVHDGKPPQGQGLRMASNMQMSLQCEEALPFPQTQSLWPSYSKGSCT